MDLSNVKSLTHDPDQWDKVLCPYCGGKVVYTSNAKIYHGKTFGNGKCYMCLVCGVSCGVHGNPATKQPLGLLATPAMKILKQSCHLKFDSVWKNKKLSRGDCYKKLAILMKINPKRCHFGWFDISELMLANNIMNDKNWFK